MLAKLDYKIRIAVDRILPKNLTIRYTVSLLVVAALALADQVIVQATLSMAMLGLEKLRMFRQIELVLMISTLIVLVFEGLYVFRPAVQSLYGALRVRSDFLGRMGHEMRNPMNSILGMSQLLENTPLNEQQKKYLSVLKKSSSGLLEVLNNLLDFSSLESGQLKVETIPFDFIKQLEYSIDQFIYSAHIAGIDLVFDWDQNVPRKLVGDPMRLQQVLNNLLGNAVKFTKNGKITLRASMIQKNDIEQVQIEVIDTGVGIDGDKIEKIFDPFVQEDSTIRRKFGGTGLGLSISRDLVAALGGTLCVESEKNKGSRFYFSIPKIIPKRESALALDKEVNSPKIEILQDVRPLRILAVDDSKDNQFLVKAYLGSLPYQITFADHGGEGFSKFKDAGFDLVLMDLQMPEVDGYSATRMIRRWEYEQKQATIPIVAVSAHDREQDSDRFRRAQFSAYLVKPISAEQLRQTILDLTRHIPGLNYPPIPAQSFQIKNIAAQIEKELSDLVPGYLSNKKREVTELRKFLIDSNFERIKSFGHRLRGNAKSYGFANLGELGKELEEAAEKSDSKQVKIILDETEKLVNSLGGTYGVSKTEFV